MTRERLVEIIGMMGVGGFGEQSAADLILQELAKEKQEAPAGLIEELRVWEKRWPHSTIGGKGDFNEILSRYESRKEIVVGTSSTGKWVWYDLRDRVDGLAGKLIFIPSEDTK